MVKPYKFVGHTFPIHDAEQKVRGEVVYTGDMELPGMLHAKLLLSPIAHGMIKKIDLTKAECLPGVVKIFTHLNAPSILFNSYILYSGQENCPQDEQLFPEKVRFVGDRVAVVVAKSLEIAKKAVSLIDVEYEELPAMVTPQDALSENAVKIHPEGNLIAEYKFQIRDGRLLKEASDETLGGVLIEKSRETLDEEIETIKTTIHTQSTHQGAMENHVCIASCDSAGKLTIWTPCQGVYGVRTIVAELLGLKYNMVRVIKTTMGGSFGSKQSPILELVTAFLAYEIRRPIKIQFNRTENIMATVVRPAIESRLETKVAKDGHLISTKIETDLAAGGYITSAIDYSASLGAKLTKLYRINEIFNIGRAVYTNTPITGGARGWGSPEFFAPWEIHMDQIAKKLALDPVEFRLKNLIYPGDLDQKTQISLGNAQVRHCLEKGAATFRWKERYGAEDRNNLTEGFARGVGMACGAHKNGFYGGWPELSTMTLKMNEDGSFALNTCIHDMGCGTVVSMKQIVAEVLEVHPDLITVLEGDTDISPYDFGTYGSRVTYICGACAYQTAIKIKEKILGAAALLLKKPEKMLEMGDGEVWVTGERDNSLKYSEIALKSLTNLNKSLIVTYAYEGTSNPGVYGVHFAEVLVDKKTGLIKVTDYLAVQDVGQALNPGMAEAQVQGAVQMGIGYALCEDIGIDKKGRPKNNSFKKYHLINAPDMPDVRVILVEEGKDDGPFGAKSLGEIAMVPVAPAVVNAVNNALNTNLTELPLTPEKIIAALANQRAENGQRA